MLVSRLTTASNRLKSPFFRAVLLSLCLHLALLGLVQVQSMGGRERAQVIQVRLTLNEAGSEGVSEPAPAHLSEPAQATALAETTQTDAGSGDAAHGPEAADPTLDLPMMVDLHWYGPREVDDHPRALSPIQPAYPEAARRQGQVGWVKVRLKIDEQGRVTDTEVVESQPRGIFDAATIEAFRRAQFEPARRQGMPVRYEGLFRVMFELE